MNRRVRRSDDGFTLPELLISIVILSFIVGAIGFSLTVVLRNTRATASRSVSNLSAQSLNAWFAGDVQSAAVDGGDTTPTAVTGCPGNEPGRNVLLLRRADGLAVVSYQVVQDTIVTDRAEYQLWRVTCVDGTRLRNVVAQALASDDNNAVRVEPALLDAGTPVGTVRLTVVTGVPTDRVTVTVSGTARTRNPDEPVPCALVAATPDAIALVLGRPGSDVRFSAHVVGDCGAMTLQLPTLGTPATVTLDLGATGATRTAVLVAAAATWGSGTRTATVTNRGATLGTFPLYASAEPCAPVSASVTALEFRPLGAPIDYAVRMRGLCTSGVAINVPGGGSQATISRALTQLSSDTWTTTLPTDLSWAAGSKRVNVLSGGPSPTNLGGLPLVVTAAPCVLVNGATVVPPRMDSSGKLTGNLGVTVTTSGVCGRIGMSVPTLGGTPQDPWVDPQLDEGPVTWTTTIPRPGQTWTPGPRVVTITNDDDFLGTFPFDLVQVCAMVSSPSSATVSIGVDDRVLAPTTFTIGTVGTCGTITMAVPTGGLPSSITLTAVTTGSSHTATAQHADATWSVGSGRTVTVSDGGTVLGTFPVGVTRQPCTVVGGTLRIGISPTAPKQVPADTPISVQTSGGCPQPLRVSLPTGSGPVDPLVVTLAPSATPNVWNGTIQPADAIWTTSTVIPRTAAVTANGVPVGTYQFVVSDCSVVPNSNTTTINVSSGTVSNGNQRITYRTVGTCQSTMTLEFTPAGGTVQRVTATPTSPGNWESGQLSSGMVWLSGRAAVTVSVHDSVAQPFTASTLAGTFEVTGT